MTLFLVLCLAPVATALIRDELPPRELLPLHKRSKASYPTSLHDVAIGMISGRASYANIIKDKILRHTPHGYLLRAPGNCGCNFRFGFKLLAKKAPHAKWYYAGDDDAFINLQNLVTTLSAYDPTKKIVMAAAGHPIDIQGCKVHVAAHPGADKLNFFYGGLGQILSAGLVHSPEYQQMTKGACLPYNKLFGPDGEHSCSLARLWQKDYVYINLGDRRILPRSASHAPSFVVAHHLSPEDIRAFASVNKGHKKYARKRMEIRLPNTCKSVQKRRHSRVKPRAFLEVGANGSFDDYSKSMDPAQLQEQTRGKKPFVEPSSFREY